MKEFLPVLIRSRLFKGLDENEISTILKCLNANTLCFNKGSFLFNDGDVATFIGIVLSGEIQMQNADYNGNVNIVSKLYSSDVIAASACYSTDKNLPFDVACVSDCQIMYFDINRLVRPCVNACSFHSELIYNMLNIIADKNIMLARKIDILSKRSIREKVLTFLLAQAKKAKNQKFSVLLSRRQMAEYLSINRSALSRELCNLRDENLIEFKGNSFLLKNRLKNL